MTILRPEPPIVPESVAVAVARAVGAETAAAQREARAALESIAARLDAHRHRWPLTAADTTCLLLHRIGGA